MADFDPAEALGSAFRGKTREEKCDDFEAAVVGATLKQLGWSPAKVARVSRETNGLTWDWFNAEAGVPVRVGSTRLFDYNLVEVIEKPSKHPLVEAFLSLVAKDPDDDQPVALIFRLAAKRWVATNEEVAGENSIRVFLPNHTLTLLPYSKFFHRWRNDDEEAPDPC